MIRRIAVAMGLFVCGLMTTACMGGGFGSSSSAHSSKLVDGSYEQVHILPYSDYEVLGMVFVTTKEYEKNDRPYLTYLELLKKASELGGHAIVNVSIEESRNCYKLDHDVFPYKTDETACEINRFGSALAIKYTKTITDPVILEQLSSLPQSETKTDEVKTEKSNSIIPFL